MFESFGSWLVAGLAVFALFCAFYAWIVGLYQRIREQRHENKRLRHELNVAREENAWLLSRCESSVDHRVFIRDTEIDKLTGELEAMQKKVSELETLLEQKWKGAKAK